METHQVMETVSEAQNSFVSYVLTQLEALLGQNEAQFRAVRKLVLDKHNDNLRRLRRQLGTDEDRS